MVVRSALIVALLPLAACVGRPKDTLVAHSCRQAPPSWSQAVPSRDELKRRASSVSHVVRGRLRWTGSAIDEEPGSQRELDYAVVDILEFHRGDAWSVSPRMRRSFPLLAESPALEALRCREGEAFFFFVDLPGRSAKEWPGGAPDPAVRAFGEDAVELVAIIPEEERERVQAALAATP